MKILVCIKQVPDMEAKFKVNAAGTWYEDAELAWRMNEYDEYAVEQAVQLKEQVGDAELTVLSVGSGRITEIMKKALAMGCDRGVHIVDDQSALKDSYEIASIISEYAKDKAFDLIFTGMQSQDRGSGQIGILIGEMLSISSISTIVDFSLSESTVTVKRELEGGVKAKVSAALPVLVTCQLGLNTPRYPTLPNIMKAKKKEVETIAANDLLHVEKLLNPAAMFVPVKKSGGLVLEGDAQDLAEQVIRLIKENTGVLA